MATMLYPNELVINDKNFEEIYCPEINGVKVSKGLVPRNYATNPVGSLQGIGRFDEPLIPRSDWSSMIKDMVQSESRLSDIRMKADNGKPIDSLDQGNYGYCWAHSVTASVIMCRAVNNLPYVRLSAFAIACMIKRFRDEGGWNGQAFKFFKDTGCPSVLFWPEKSVNRNLANDAEVWANAAKHKVTEGVFDLQAAIYDQKMAFDQVMTCLLRRKPVAGDFNHWGHSVSLLDPVELDSSLRLDDPNRWGIRYWNSWTNRHGFMGMGVLSGWKAIPDGSTAIEVTGASEV